MLASVAVACALLGRVTQIDHRSFRTCTFDTDCEIFQPEANGACEAKQQCSCQVNGMTDSAPQCFSDPITNQPTEYDYMNVVWAMTHERFISATDPSFQSKRIVDCQEPAHSNFARAYYPEVQALLPSTIRNLEIKHICYTNTNGDGVMKSMVKFDAPASLIVTASSSSDGDKINKLATNINGQVLKETQPSTPATKEDLRAGGVIVHAYAATTQALRKCISENELTVLSVSFITEATKDQALALSDYLDGVTPVGCTPVICPTGFTLVQIGNGETTCQPGETNVPTQAPETTAPSPDDVSRSVTVEVTVTGDLTSLQSSLSDLELAVGVGLGGATPVACTSLCRRKLNVDHYVDDECLSSCTGQSVETTARSVHELALRRWRFSFVGTTSYTHELALKRVSEGIKGVLGDTPLNLLVIVEPSGYRDFSDDELSDGAIAGIVIGCTIFLCIIIFIIYSCCCKGSQSDEEGEELDAADEATEESEEK
eukprot:TRINITY_DN5703_c0_g1_i1.p2 TRINITY_DN5703_c0_g1~~TRINITY_DN5703_c0_g1_i1.p2  ORF type:complete len:486 (+),score=86.84 TRINITY_DN5703_c0_g1_i1:1726-3183(+)